MLCILFALGMLSACENGTSRSGLPVESRSPSSPPPQNAAPSQPDEAPQPEERVVRFSFVGDNLVHDGIFLQAARRAETEEGYDFSFCFAQSQYFFEQFDVNWMNQETLLNDTYTPAGYPMFSTPSQMGQATYNAGWRVYSLSNNHTYDLGAGGIAETRRVWSEMPGDVLTTGLFTGRTESDGIALHEVNGITIAYLAYTDHTNGLPPPKDAEAFVIYTSERDVIESQVRKAAQLADVVIVGVHWEVENSHNVTDTQRNLAAQLADWGATAVIGTHPHVIQPIEVVTGEESGRTIPVAYSLGNFLSAQSQANQLVGIVFALDIAVVVRADGSRGDAQVQKTQAYPVITHYGAGYSDIHNYMLREYSDELAALHGVRSQYPAFSMAYITDLLESYIDPEYLVLNW